ncbi:hypothetical protein [Bordetella sp. N]|uniref:FitA-like ribbon-helix-helix domain-containing protein n=1 Tax=Bordetella sp. N TaxID=1746199 RepID=UPI000710CD61|nr:hypothetical protein [Bordetella sp. N]ALM84822.1 DNA-binding protein [Bordetella sp. N]
MANFRERNVDDELAERLREPAASSGRSAEAEHRESLEKALREPQRKTFAEVLMDIPDVGHDEDYARVDDDRSD